MITINTKMSSINFATLTNECVSIRDASTQITPYANDVDMSNSENEMHEHIISIGQLAG